MTGMKARNRSIATAHRQYGPREDPVGNGSIECCLDHTKIGHRDEDDGVCTGVMITHYTAEALSTGNSQRVGLDSPSSFSSCMTP